jgi:hypothetical protein
MSVQNLVKFAGRFFYSQRVCVYKMRLTKRAPDAGESAAIPSSFLRLSIFPVGRRSAAHPSAGNANRWAAVRKIIENTQLQ